MEDLLVLAKPAKSFAELKPAWHGENGVRIQKEEQTGWNDAFKKL